MSTLYIIGIMSFLVLFFVSRFLNENALKILSPEEKAKLIDEFSSMRKYYILPIILIIGAFFLITKYFPQWYLYIFISYFVVLIIFLIITSIYSFKKLHRMELPEKYITKFIYSRISQYIGIAILFATILFDVFQKIN